MRCSGRLGVRSATCSALRQPGHVALRCSQDSMHAAQKHVWQHGPSTTLSSISQQIEHSSAERSIIMDGSYARERASKRASSHQTNDDDDWCFLMMMDVTLRLYNNGPFTRTALLHNSASSISRRVYPRCRWEMVDGGVLEATLSGEPRGRHTSRTARSISDRITGRGASSLFLTARTNEQARYRVWLRVRGLVSYASWQPPPHHHRHHHRH